MIKEEELTNNIRTIKFLEETILKDIKNPVVPHLEFEVLKLRIRNSKILEEILGQTLNSRLR